MANYPLVKKNKEGTLLLPHGSFYSDEYCEDACSLYLHSELHNDESSKTQDYYRLQAKEPHSEEMTLAYDILCPKCGGVMKKATRCNSYHDLGLYTCPVCNKNKESR